MKAIAIIQLPVSSIIVTLTSALFVWSALSESAWAALETPKEGEEAGPKVWPANPAQHQIVIKREAADTKQAAMISAAESAQVSKESMRQALSRL